jgi:hypothetical protein
MQMGNRIEKSPRVLARNLAGIKPSLARDSDYEKDENGHRQR